jgi:cytochrome c556
MHINFSVVRLGAFAAILGAGVVTSSDIGMAQGSRTPVPLPSPQQIVIARQAALEMSAITLGSMKLALRDGKEAKTQGFYAGALLSWAQSLPAMFPSGTGIGETAIENKARPEIWSNRKDFEAKDANYVAAVARLNEMVEANDTADFLNQLSTIKEACDACHKDYQERE